MITRTSISTRCRLSLRLLQIKTFTCVWALADKRVQIGTAKGGPEIPDDISADAQKFLELTFMLCAESPLFLLALVLTNHLQRLQCPSLSVRNAAECFHWRSQWRHCLTADTDCCQLFIVTDYFHLLSYLVCRSMSICGIASIHLYHTPSSNCLLINNGIAACGSFQPSLICWILCQIKVRICLTMRAESAS